MPRTRHTVLGAFTGMFYETADGNRLYLAHRTIRQVDRRRKAWLLEASTLDRCRDQGIAAVGVICRKNGARRVYLTHIDDFFGEHSFAVFGAVRQRGLPLACFRVDPIRSDRVVRAAIKLR